MEDSPSGLNGPPLPVASPVAPPTALSGHEPEAAQTLFLGLVDGNALEEHLKLWHSHVSLILAQ